MKNIAFDWLGRGFSSWFPKSANQAICFPLGVSTIAELVTANHFERIMSKQNANENTECVS